jgi:hypothetical protein
MIGIGIGVDRRPPSSGGASFDADAQAFFDRVTAAGGTLSTTEKTATNQLVLDMKSAGIWTAMRAVYPMVGASAAACAQNLKSSSFTGTFSSGWTFASTGVTGNGTSAFMDTLLTPNISLTANNTHFTIYSRTNVASLSQQDMGCDDGGASAFLPIIEVNSRTDANNFRYRGYDYTSHQLDTSNTDSRGFFHANNLTSTNQKTYKNGIQQGQITIAQTYGLPSYKLSLAGRNDGGTTFNFSTRQYAFASIGDGLTDTQASNFYTAVQAFQVSLSRSV